MTDADKPRPQGNVNDARISRYAKVDLAGITVRRAVTDADFELVGQLRQTGFSRVAGQEEAAWVDELDRSAGVFSLIAYNSLNEPVATMRVQDGRVADLELSRFVPLNTLLTARQKPAAQFARLSVVKGSQSTDAMFGLFKAAWRWCLRERLQSIVIATPPWSKMIYDFMFFEELGPDGRFNHEFANDALHASMLLPVAEAEEIWRVGRSPLCEQLFDIEHPDLNFR